ncbi:MAG: hypothetical protein ABGX16_08340 [Pirellulales bacterium]
MMQVDEQWYNKSNPIYCPRWEILQRATMGWPIGQILLLTTSLLLLVVQPATVRAEPEDLNEPADTTSPQATLRSFIDSGNRLYQLFNQGQGTYRYSSEIRAMSQRMLDCLDVSELPEFSREDYRSEAAVCLKEILDRIQLPPCDQIPNAKKVDSVEGREEFSQWKIPRSRLPLVEWRKGHVAMSTCSRQERWDG